ncbi:MAG: hypothetical protein Q8L37_04345 [Candidatus Gottesmanbacteria bacterium]|nr:hypothetical protein [Candidatus Gottesmanbacteria bacterium]
MRIKALLGSVVGIADSVHWGQVLSSPTAYGVVEVEDSDGHARAWGLKVLANLSDQLVDPPKSLKVTREIAMKSMEERVTSLILLVPVGMVVYVVMLGEGRVSLKRGSTLSVLMEKPGAISGQVQEGDMMVVMTKSVSQLLTHDETSTLFDHSDAPAVAEKMTIALHSHPEAPEGSVAGSAAIIIQVKGLIPIEEERTAMLNGKSPAVDVSLKSRGKRAWQTIRRIRPRHFHPRDIKRRLNNLPDAWRRPMMPITIILIILFLLSVLLGIRRQMGQKVEARVAQVLAQAQYAFDEGVALLELNPVKARERLAQAKTDLFPLRESLAPSSLEGKAVAKLYKDVVDQLTVAMQVNRAEPLLFYDISLLKPSAAISSLGSDGQTLGTLDVRGPTVATITIPAKNGKIVAGGSSFVGAKLLTVRGDNVYVLVDDGIHAVSLRDGKTTPLIIKKPSPMAGGDTQWGSIVGMVSYGGNIYLLDVGKSRVWKYVATERGFSGMSEYLNPDTLPDLSQGTGMAVDGGIWVGTRFGGILRFNQGRQETFTPRGIEPGLGKTIVVATTEEDKHLYVLDSDNKRVVVLDKDGVYLAQYVWTGTSIPTELMVSERLKLILLLADGKLYSLQLK